MLYRICAIFDGSMMPHSIVTQMTPDAYAQGIQFPCNISMIDFYILTGRSVFPLCSPVACW